MLSESLESIDEQIAFHRSCIVTLETKRNACMRINRLPPETLSHIFSFFRSLEVLSMVCAGRLKNLVAYTHVCSHWRAVALSFPSLWSSIDFTYPKWTREMFVRSKMAALTVDVPATRASDLEIMAYIAASMSRIRTFTLTAGVSALAVVNDTFASATPILETFDLTYSGTTDLGADMGTLLLPGPVFGGQAPKLRDLKIRGYAMDWDSIGFATVVRLHLQEVPRVWRPSLPQLMRILSAMPALEVLMILDALPVAAAESTESTPLQCEAVQLRHLTRVALSGSASECADILFHIDFPSDATLHSHADHVSGSGRSSLVRALRRRFWHGTAGCVGRSPDPLKWLVVTTRYESTTLMVGPSSNPSSTTVSVVHAPGPDPTSILPLLLELGAAMPLGDLNAVSASSVIDCPRDFWVQLLGRSAHLKFASVSDAAAVGFVDALTVEMPTREIGMGAPSHHMATALPEDARARAPGLSWDTAQATAVFLPALRELDVQRANFDTLHPILLDRLMERCVRGVEIRQLDIADCSSVRGSYLDDLSMVVVDVNFDYEGFVRQSEEEDSNHDSDEAHGLWY